MKKEFIIRALIFAVIGILLGQIREALGVLVFSALLCSVGFFDENSSP